MIYHQIFSFNIIQIISVKCYVSPCYISLGLLIVLHYFDHDIISHFYPYLSIQSPSSGRPKAINKKKSLIYNNFQTQDPSLEVIATSQVYDGSSTGGDTYGSIRTPLRRFVNPELEAEGIKTHRYR